MSVNYEECMAACLECMKACNTCYSACLEEENVKMMVNCIRLDRECADICALAAKAIQTNSPFLSQICQLCAEVCEACGNACREHEAEHCQQCADACFKCAEACRQMVNN